MSLKEFISWLTVILLWSLHQSPVTARPNIAPSDAGTIFNDALNTESRIDEVPPLDTLQATPPPNFEDTYPIDDGNATQIVTEVLPLSTGTDDEVSLNQVRDKDNTTEDTKTSIIFDETTTVENSTDVVKDSQLGVLVTDVTTQEIPSANIDFDVSTLNIPTATVPNFEESKIFEDIPININKEIIKLEEEIIKNNLEMNPLVNSMPASPSSSFIPTTTSESTSINFEHSKIIEDAHKEYDETIRLEDSLLKQLEVLEAVRNNIEEATTVKYVKSTESSLKFTMEDDELTSIESIFGDTTNLGAMSSIGDALDELENVSDIFTESPFSVENTNGENTDILNVSNGEQFEQFEDDSTNTRSMTPIDTIEEFTTQSIEAKESITEDNLENMKPSREETYNATSVTDNTIEEKESAYTTEQSGGSVIVNKDIRMEGIDEVTTEQIKTTTASTNDSDDSFNEGLLSSEDYIANATEDGANSTEESMYTTDKTPQTLNNEGSGLDSITEDNYLISEKMYNSNMPEFSLFAGDAPTVSPLDFDDLDAVSTDLQYDEVDSDMTNIEYVSETGSGDYQVDVTTATENSEIISEEIIGNGRFYTINIIDLLSRRTTEIPTTAKPAATTSTTEDSKLSTEHFIVNFDQDETSEQIKANSGLSTGIEESIVNVDNETEKPTLTEPHFTVRDDDLYNPKSVIEVEDNILSLLPILEDALLSKQESVTEQHQTSVKLSVPVSSAEEATIKNKNITESPIVNSTTIDALNTSSDEGNNLSVTTASKFDEAYEKQAIISTSEHSTVVEYRHSDSAEICFEGSFGYQLTADVMDKDGNEHRLDTPKYKDTFKKKCVNSKFPVLRITQNYSSIELRFLLEPSYLFVDEISAMISLEGHDYQAVSSDIDLFISLLDDSGTLRTNLHREFIRERSKPEGTSMIVTLFDVQLAAHTSANYERITEGTSINEPQDGELNGDEAQDEAIHTAVLVVTVLLSAATLLIVVVLLVKIFLKYKSKKMVYILSVR